MVSLLLRLCDCLNYLTIFLCIYWLREISTQKNEDFLTQRRLLHRDCLIENPLGFLGSHPTMDYAKAIPLISECIAGNEYAVEQFICQYQSGVFRLALSVLQDEHEANDVTQDTFIAALKALNGYQDYSSIKAWLYTITMNMSRSRLRKRKTIENLKRTMTVLFQAEFQKQISPEDAVVQNEKDQSLWCALQNLGEKHRLPVLLYYYHELPVSEIAEILQISEGTVHSRLFTARTRLRLEMQERLQSAGETK